MWPRQHCGRFSGSVSIVSLAALVGSAVSLKGLGLVKLKNFEVVMVHVDSSAFKFQGMILSPKFSFLEFHRGVSFPFTKVLCSMKWKVFRQSLSVEKAF